MVAAAKAGNPVEVFARAEIHLTFFQAVSGVERGQDDHAGEYGRVWSTTHDPPPPAPPHKKEGEPTEFAALYRIEFWKMDLGAFTGRGQGGPCLTDAAQ